MREPLDDDVSTFAQLLDMDKSLCLHHQNIQRLLFEIYKALHDNSENSLNELFVRRESTINLQCKRELLISLENFVLKGKKQKT